MKNSYEFFVVLSTKAATGEQDAFMGKLEKVMADNDVEKVARDDWGKRALAYPIAKQKDGRYIVYHLKSPPAVVKELERNCRLAEVVLRYLAISVSKLKPGVLPTEATGRRRSFDRRGGGDRYRPRGGSSYGDRPPRRDSSGPPVRPAAKDAGAVKPSAENGGK